ncbi:hypothetical protein J6590_078945 [Homalodisca vitripennis]|nr:hypothetical protein J6590_078945 [Homalodisca vitripennis]
MELAMKKRWKSIRTCYGRELLKLKNQKGPEATGRRQYLHFDQLRFLDGVINNKSVSSVGEADGEQQERKPTNTPKQRKRNKEESEDNVTKQPKKKMALDKTKNENCVQKRIFINVNENRVTELDKESDKMFLLSLVSDLHRVPRDRKLQLKAEILLAIAKAQAEPSSCPSNFVEIWQNQANTPVDTLPAFSSERVDLQSDERDHLEDPRSHEQPSFIKVEECSLGEEIEADIFDSEESSMSAAEGVGQTLRDFFKI